MTTIRARALPAFVAGLRATAARPWLVAVVWAWHLVIATAVAVPLFRGLLTVTALAPAADRLLQGFSFSLFGELLHYNQAPLLAMGQAGALGGFIVGIASAPALLAAILLALDAPRRPAPGELAAAAGRSYWPFLRLFVFGRAAGVLLAVLAGAAAFGALKPVRESLWEAGRLASIPIVGLVGLAGLALGWAAVDYALIHATRTGSHRMFAAWWTGVRTVVRRPVTTLGLWASMALLLVFVAVALLLLFGGLTASTAPLIALAFVVQQAFVVVRIALRVALLGAEGIAWRVIPDAVTEAVPAEAKRLETALAADPEADVTPLPAPAHGQA